MRRDIPICPMCKKPVLEGMSMWNGFAFNQGFFHWECRPEKYKNKKVSNARKLELRAYDNIKTLNDLKD